MQPHSDKLGNNISMIQSTEVEERGLQDGETIVSKVLDLDVPAGGLEVTIAPRVVVEGEEIGSHIIRTTVEVVGGLHTVLSDISSRVSNGDLAETTSADVVADITGDGLDIGSGLVSVVLVVDDLVS